ncbi:uncharacterized protein LOC130734144 [Lotus japonicus]|uniref:uncharacterized protein LOC130734144 n=1 Tax=Lotus japonicus TaxID=34305 RepID=UPI00258B12BB|nr:uncharacterized protein LOC130734144 [Lotus japonicus]
MVGLLWRSMPPELKKLAIQILSLTCSSSGCEHNWSSFEMVHTKKRNRLHQQKMNDLVYVMHNLKLKRKGTKRKVFIPLEDIESDNEWITNVGDVEGERNNVNVYEDDDVQHVDDDLVASSSNPPTLDDDYIQETFSSEEEENMDDDEGESEDDDMEDV